jgi:hypothetical protein
MGKTAGKPAKTKQVEARRERIAAAVVAGETVTAIARREKLTRSWTSELANSLEVRQRIAHLVDAEHERLSEAFARSVDVIGEALGAMDNKNAAIKFTDEDGEKQTIIREVPDHYARLAAVKTLIALLQAGRPPAEKPKEAADRKLTLDEIEAAIRARDAA